jgi:AcrR family transcriptional regulator
VSTADLKRSGRATAMPPDERRTAIAQATLPLLLERGEMVSTREIAEAAGIAEGTIFRVFADKDEVISAVIDDALDPTALELALEAIDRSTPLAEVLLATIELLQQRTIEIWRVMSSVGPRWHDRVRRPMADSPALVALLAAHLDALTLDAPAAARLLRAMILATTHPMMAEEPMPPAEIAHLFLHGAGREGRC